MSYECETVRVKSEISADNDSGYVVINLSDFDDEIHELFGVEKIETPVSTSPVDSTSTSKPWQN